MNNIRFSPHIKILVAILLLMLSHPVCVSFANDGSYRVDPIIINGKRSLTQEMFSKRDVQYVINTNCNLRGKTITIPENCCLNFDGGKISNGTIIGNHTKVLSSKRQIIDTDIVLLGSWVADKAYSIWFGAKADCKMDSQYRYESGTNNIKAFCNMLKFNNVEIIPGRYYVEGHLSAISDQVINGNGSII